MSHIQYCVNRVIQPEAQTQERLKQYSNEIDMVLESDGLLHPMEIKRSVNPGSELVRAFQILDKSSVPRGTGAILCMRSELSAVDRDNLIVPIWMI